MSDRPTNPPLRFAIGIQIDGAIHQRISTAFHNKPVAQTVVPALYDALADADRMVWWPFEVPSVPGHAVAADGEWVTSIAVQAIESAK
jgi:hypothetical protein